MQKQLIPAAFWRKEKAAMQISKALLMFCACVLAATLNVHAQDNAAQSAAREALAAKLFEMDAGNPSPTNTSAPAAASKPVIAPKAPIADVPPARTAPSNEPVMYPVGGSTAPETAAQRKADIKAQKAAAKQAAAVKAQEDAAAKAQADADAKAKNSLTRIRPKSTTPKWPPPKNRPNSIPMPP